MTLKTQSHMHLFALWDFVWAFHLFLTLDLERENIILDSDRLLRFDLYFLYIGYLLGL
jgi:hypothetical protein